MVISVKKGYECMIHFLDKIYLKTQMDDLGSVLGSMDINLDDGKPMDLAFERYWIEAVNRVSSNIKINESEIYLAMIEFIKAHALRTKSNDLKCLVQALLNKNLDNPYQISIEEEWISSFNLLL